MNSRRIFFEMASKMNFENYLCLANVRNIVLKPEM
jgi:hypothetical protein